MVGQLPPLARNSHTPRSQRIENIPCRHPDPDRLAAGLHVGTRATTPGRQRRIAASGGNYSATGATAHGSSNAASARPDEYARTAGHGDPGADPDDGTGANCDTNATDGYYATHGNTYLRAAHTHAAPTSQPALPTATATISTTTTVLRVTVSSIPSNLPTYDRHDWKHWTDADGDCQDARQDARQEVQVAESRTRPNFRTDRRCRVTSGQWLAPYTNTVVTDPGKLDIDHMVPLGNAHDSGAWRWTAQQQERYANFLGEPQHLIAVTASANRSKGARGPENWKPEDRSYWCQYAVDWITSKDTWELTVTQAEHDALAKMLGSCANPPQLTVSRQTQIEPTPVPTRNAVQPTPATRTYASCDVAQAAGELRVQGSKGSGRGFPKWMVPSARDGDGDSVVCEM